MKAALEIIDAFSQGHVSARRSLSLPGTRAYRSAWEETIEAAEKYNEPGRFTAFIGYEWTSNTAGNNLHRVVIYRDGGDKAVQTEPFTHVSARRQRQPAKTCGSDCRPTRRRPAARCSRSPTTAISRTASCSRSIESFTGKPLDREYAETRARWEPLYEVTQIKGDGEAHPFLSPNDEFAGYELWDKGNLNLSEPKKPEMLQYEYARTALQIGLQLEQKLGVNPYKFGMIGSTDSHTSLSTADEDNFFGKHSGTEPSPTAPSTRRHAVQRRLCDHGLGAGRLGLRRRLGDREHARSDLRRDGAQGDLRHHRPAHDRALLRRLGLHARPTPRPATRPRPATPRACRWAATCSAAPAGKAPTFLVAALKDPIGANLDRIQIVKGWLDAQGRARRRRSTTWSGRATASRRRRQAAAGRQHRRRRRTRPGRTRSAPPS